MNLNIVRHVTRTAAVLLFCLSPHSRVHAAEGDVPAQWSGQIAVVSDYVYRGQTLSNGGPAIQGFVDWRNMENTALSGLHADLWASSVNFGKGDPTDAELAATLGYQMGDAVMFDASLRYIAYPGSPRGGHYDYFEAIGTASAALGAGDVSAAVHYTPSYSGDAGPATFIVVESLWPLSGRVSFAAVGGYAHVSPLAGEDHFYWQIGLAAQAVGLTFDVRYHGSDERHCHILACGHRVALTVSRAF